MSTISVSSPNRAGTWKHCPPWHNNIYIKHIKGSAMDIVYVRGLEVKTVIGVYEWEREIKQPVTVDLDMACDISEAAKTDDHHHVLDYKIVCVRVTEFIEKSNLKLLEAMAEEIAKLVRTEF